VLLMLISPNRARLEIEAVPRGALLTAIALKPARHGARVEARLEIEVIFL